MADTKRWVHPHATEDARFPSRKSLSRDRDSRRSKFRHHFSHGTKNSRENLLEKNRELSLREAMNEDYSPRTRKNHSHPYDGARAWNRMIQHSEALRWKYPYCPNNRDHCVSGWEEGGKRGWHCLKCKIDIYEKE